jgi:hypothetical protein
MKILLGEISGSHSCLYSHDSVLRCDILNMHMDTERERSERIKSSQKKVFIEYYEMNRS